MKNKRSPDERVGVTGLDLVTGQSQGLGSGLTGLEMTVESLHVLDGLQGRDLPEADQNTLGPGMLESPGKVGNSFSFHDLATTGKAGGKDNHIRFELEAKYFAHS